MRKRVLKALLNNHVIYWEGKKYFADFTQNPAVKHMYRMAFPHIPELTDAVAEQILWSFKNKPSLTP